MLQLKIDLADLQLRLQSAKDLLEKLSIFENESSIKKFCDTHAVGAFLPVLRDTQKLMLYSTIAIGQASHIFAWPQATKDVKEKLKVLLNNLYEVENFYAPIGGLIGYHQTALALLKPTEICKKQAFEPPEGIDLRSDNKKTRAAYLHAIEHWSDFAEAYPVGGAADRLKLKAASSSLPAARLEFAGTSLLAGLLRDLQAREYLHYKLFGKQLTTPIVMMTSHEKDNASHIRSILEENNWFHRPKSSIKIAEQPLVPTLDENGVWCVKGPLDLLLKPGGHGAIWQLMARESIFDWLLNRGAKSLFLRQINNPIACIDSSALSFLGFGHKDRKAFGFASCLRLVGSAEGVNVVRKDSHGRYALTNVEYCAFERFGIEDIKRKKNDPHSQFPSNTNILYADIEKAKQTAARYPLPGMLLNFRKIGDKKLARIEAMMQNIADAFTASSKSNLPTYITFNHRHKTISTTKRKFAKGGSALETPEGCFFDLLKNAHDLLSNHCNFSLPELDEKTFFENGPSFTFLYHPALGPIYSIIAQKLKSGTLAKHSELVLNLADIDLENLNLTGSLIIDTPTPTGHIDARSLLRFSNQTGRCILKNITVKNKGKSRSKKEPFWSHAPKRLESLHIELDPSSLFIAENVTFKGTHAIHVPKNTCMTAHQSGSDIIYTTRPYDPTTPFYTYTATKDAHIKLQR